MNLHGFLALSLAATTFFSSVASVSGADIDINTEPASAYEEEADDLIYKENDIDTIIESDTDKCGLLPMRATLIDEVDASDVAVRVDEYGRIRVDRSVLSSPYGTTANKEWAEYGSYYFYNMMNTYERAFYDALMTECLVYMNGGGDINGDSLPGVQAHSSIDFERAQNIYYIFRYENPEFYFLESAFSYYGETAPITICPSIYPKFKTQSSRVAATSTIKNKVDEYIDVANDYAEEKDRVRAIHDKITEEVCYNHPAAVNPASARPPEEETFSQSVYSTFTTAAYDYYKDYYDYCSQYTTVCAGYAGGFAMICNKMGIDAIVLTSEGHAWNRVKVNGIWYTIDCTWDDTDGTSKVNHEGTICNEFIDNQTKYEYYLRSDSKLKELDSDSHSEKLMWTGLPACSIDCTPSSGIIGTRPHNLYIYFVNEPGEPGSPESGAATPVISEEFSSGITYDVTITGAEGAKIYYTTDGTEPREGQGMCNYYTGAFQAELGTTVKAMAVKDPLAQSATVSESIGGTPITSSMLTLSASSYTYNGTEIEPTLTVKDGDTTLTKGTDYTVSGGTSGTNAGSYTITVTGMGNYGGTATIGWTINKATLTVTADAKSKTYGASDPALTYTSTGLAAGDSITGALSRAAGENVGTYAISQGTLTAGDNYEISFTGATFTINKASSSITIASGNDSYSKTYGDAAFSLSGISTSPVGRTVTYAVTSGGDVISLSGSRVTILKAGTAQIKVSYAGDTNYDAATDKTITVNVSKAPLTVVAGAKSKTSGADDPELTYTVTGFKNNDNKANTMSGALVRAAGEDVGPHAISQGTLSAGNNYEIAFTGANLTINKPITSLTLTLNQSSFTYDKTAKTPVLTVKDGETALTKDVDYTVSGDLAKTNAGSYTITVVGNGYYTGSTTIGWTINKATLTVTADAKSKTYGAADPSLTYTSTGLIEGDSITGDLTRAPGESVGTYAINKGTLTAGDNYEISFTGATFTINKASSSITIASGKDSYNRTYGDADFTLSGITVLPTGAAKTYAVTDGADVVSVTSAGKVKIKKNGTATIKVSVAGTANYNAAADKTITINVAKKDIPSNAPTAAINTAYANEKVSDVSLPAGWAWDDADKDKELKVGVPVNAAVNYTAADSGCYENTTKDITITRKECDHSKTEVRHAVKETCEGKGYSGDTYCTICGVRTALGHEIDALGHDYKESVTSEPTTSKEGVMTHTCTRCGDSYTTAIDKLPEPEPEPEPEPDEDEVKKDPVQVGNFVERMYSNVLKRNSDAGGRKSWSDQLLDGKLSGAGIAQGFICSNEFTSQNVSDEEYVETLYETFFNRPADAGGKAYWMEQLAEGRSRTGVLSGFVNSGEFGNLCDDFGIARGTMNEDGSSVYNEGVRNFVLRNYTQTLGRAGETAGVEDWSYRVNKGEMTMKDVAISFLHSQEFLNKNLNNEEYIKVLYRTFLGREADAGGLSYWMGEITVRGRDDIVSGFSDSAEFANIMAQYQ